MTTSSLSSLTYLSPFPAYAAYVAQSLCVDAKEDVCMEGWLHADGVYVCVWLKMNHNCPKHTSIGLTVVDRDVLNINVDRMATECGCGFLKIVSLFVLFVRSSCKVDFVSVCSVATDVSAAFDSDVKKHSRG